LGKPIQRWPVRIAGAAVAAVTLAAFVPALGNLFVDWDDGDTIVLNPLLAASLPELLSRAFGTLHGAFYIPLTWVSLWFDRQVWDLQPLGFHLTNILLHAWVALFVTLLALELQRILEPSAGGWRSASIAVLAGLLWSLHPLRVESVAWATERKDVLSAAFGLPALVLYLAYASAAAAGQRRRSDPRLWGASALAVLAMLAKPTFLVFPLALLVLDVWPLRRNERGERWPALLLEKAPLLVLAGVDAALTAIAQRPALVPLGETPALSRVLVAFKAILEYLGMMVWPSGLMPYYLHPGATAQLGDPTYLLSIAAVLAITAGAIGLRRRAPWLLATWLLFLLPLVPVLGLAQAGGQRIGDRFTYLPSIAPSLLLAFGAAAFVGFLEPRLGRAARLAVGAASLAAVVGLLAVTQRLIPIWHDSGTLWTRVIEVLPGQVGKAYYFRARHLLYDGDPAGALADASRSLVLAREKGYRRTFEVRGLRAEALAALGRLPEAAREYMGAISEAPPEEAGRYDSALREVLANSAAAAGEPAR
jgi:hypothetical protein